VFDRRQYAEIARTQLETTGERLQRVNPNRTARLDHRKSLRLARIVPAPTGAT